MNEHVEAQRARDAFILDIGGEGRYVQAWNLNPSSVRTRGSQRGAAIPRLIPGRADQIPLPDKCVQLIVCERTPLRTKAYCEIDRIIAPDGLIILRHAVPPGFDPHREAYRYLPCRLHQRNITLDSCPLQETLFFNGRCKLQRMNECRWSWWNVCGYCLNPPGEFTCHVPDWGIRENIVHISADPGEAAEQTPFRLE